MSWSKKSGLKIYANGKLVTSSNNPILETNGDHKIDTANTRSLYFYYSISFMFIIQQNEGEINIDFMESGCERYFGTS